MPLLRSDDFVSGFTVTAMGDVVLDGRDDVTLVGLQAVRGQVVPPVLAGRLPRTGSEIALGGRELRTLGKAVGDSVQAHGSQGLVSLRITGEVVLSPEVTNEQTQLGAGAVMTLGGATAVSDTQMLRNVFLVTLRKPVSPTALSRLRQQFPGTVLPATPPPEVRDLSGATALPLALALVLMLLACGTIAHTLLTSVRQRRRELAVLKTLGFVTRQVRATVAWQATAIAGAGLVVGVPLGLIAGRYAWLLFAGRTRDRPRPGHLPADPARVPRRPRPGQPDRGHPRQDRRPHPARRRPAGRVGGRGLARLAGVRSSHSQGAPWLPSSSRNGSDGQRLRTEEPRAGPHARAISSSASTGLRAACQTTACESYSDIDHSLSTAWYRNSSRGAPSLPVALDQGASAGHAVHHVSERERDPGRHGSDDVARGDGNAPHVELRAFEFSPSSWIVFNTSMNSSLKPVLEGHPPDVQPPRHEAGPPRAPR